MMYRYFTPSSQLSPFVDCHVVFEEENALIGKRLRIVSNGTTEMAIHYGSPCESYINYPGEVDCGYIYGLPQKELRDRAVDLELIWGERKGMC